MHSRAMQSKASHSRGFFFFSTEGCKEEQSIARQRKAEQSRAEVFFLVQWKGSQFIARQSNA